MDRMQRDLAFARNAGLTPEDAHAILNTLGSTDEETSNA